MRTIQTRALEGPNVWSRQRVLEVEFEAEEADAEVIGLGWERLRAWWASAETSLAPSAVPPLAWPAAPRNDAEAVLAVTLNLQRRLELPVCESLQCPQADTSRAARVIVEITEEAVGRRAWDLACDLWDAARCGREFDLTLRLTELNELALRACLGTTSGWLVHAARARGIPALRLDDMSLIQLGHGAKQRRIQTAITDRSGCIAESVSRDKVLTKNLLKRLGIPVPDGRLVCDAEAAWAAACAVGLPVVVKPRDADYGNGVSLKLTSRAEITAAFDKAREFSEQVIVERFLEGAHHRVTVVGGRIVGAVRRDPPVVVGDGRRSVRELIAELNLDPQRGAENDPSRPWLWIEVGDELRRVLASQGSGLDSIPAAGVTVVLRFEPSLCFGGGMRDVTDEVHPDVAATVIDAVSMVGLDVAGVDLIATDISIPLTEQNGGLLEVNAGPAIYLHLSPYCDPPRPVPEAIISLMFPRPEESRISIVSVCGDDEQGSVATRVFNLLRTLHAVVGRATRSGIVVGNRHLSHERGDNLAGARTLLLHPRVEAVVCEVALKRLRDEGLAFDESGVAIVLGMESASADRFDSMEERRDALRVLLTTAQPHGTVILNVDDSVVAEFAAGGGAGVIAISAEAVSAAVPRILQQGGRAVFLRGDRVVLAHGSHEFLLLPLGPIGGRLGTDADSTTTLLATIASGWALGIAPELLRRDLVPAA